MKRKAPQDQVRSEISENSKNLQLAKKLVQHNHHKLIEGELIHKELEVQSRLRDWTKRRIKEQNLTENVDYFISLKSERNSKGGRKKKVYYFTLRAAEAIAGSEPTDAGRRFLRQLLDLRDAVARGDVELIEGMIDRTDATAEQLHDIAVRAKSKSTNKAMGAAIKAKGGEGRIYPYANDRVNVLATGHTASEVKKLRKTKTTRDSYSNQELGVVIVAESSIAEVLKKEPGYGNPVIRKGVDRVVDTLGRAFDELGIGVNINQSETIQA